MVTAGAGVLPGPRTFDGGALSLIFWLLLVSLLPVAIVFGGIVYLMLGLAAGLAVVVWIHPEEAVGAGVLYLFSCGVLFPSSARMDGTTTPWETYSWAAGLLVITSAGVARLGARRALAVPRSAQAFFVAACAAAAYGLAQGAAVSYVLRQLYGALLLVVYFGMALAAGEEELFMRRTRTFGVLCAFCFFAYYAAVFGAYGFHKEMSASGAQASLLVILLFIAGIEGRRLSWVLGAGALFLVPVLIFARSSVLTVLTALPMALALKAKSKKAQLLSWLLSAVIAVPAMYPPAAEALMDELQDIRWIAEMLPPGTQAADTLTERTLQLAVAAGTVEEHPWLGGGLGGAMEWTSPFQGNLDANYVDSGWAYRCEKMGLVGAAAFLWFLVTVFRGISRESAGLSACLLSTTLVAFFSQPVFFHFTTSPCIGTIAGLLLAKKIQRKKNQAAEASAGRRRASISPLPSEA